MKGHRMVDVPMVVVNETFFATNKARTAVVFVEREDSDEGGYSITGVRGLSFNVAR